MELLKWGLCPAASVALEQLGIPASRVMQTIGSAAASAGTHAQDGTIDGHPYCAATDLRARDLARGSVRALLGRLAGAGFAAFYRCPGEDHWPTADACHIHAVYAGVKMKESLRSQVHQWLHGQNGLASRAPYVFWQPTEDQKQGVRTLFLAHNPAEG